MTDAPKHLRALPAWFYLALLSGGIFSSDAPAGLQAQEQRRLGPRAPVDYSRRHTGENPVVTVPKDEEGTIEIIFCSLLPRV